MNKTGTPGRVGQPHLEIDSPVTTDISHDRRLLLTFVSVLLQAVLNERARFFSATANRDGNESHEGHNARRRLRL